MRIRQARRQTGDVSYTSRDVLLSRGEAAFFRPLRAAVGRDLLIMCKVRLADVVTCAVTRGRHGPFASISQKHLDFVLCDPRTLRIVLAIELDDRSHDAENRKKRDRFVDEVLEGAGVRLVRFLARARYDAVYIRDCLRYELDQISGPAARRHPAGGNMQHAESNPS